MVRLAPFNEGGRHLVESGRVAKRSSTQCHMPQNTSISVRYIPPPPHVGHPIPPWDVSAAP